MSEHVHAIKEWVGSFRQDVETVKAVLECESADMEARKLAAAALGYLVTRMDLIPDWNETIGVMDDVLVLRVCTELACEYGLPESLDSDALVRVGRMKSEAAELEDFLGQELFAKLRRYCARLVTTPVRGRSVESVIGDAGARKALYDEVAEEILRMPAAPFEDVASIEVHFKSYLHHKLGQQS